MRRLRRKLGAWAGPPWPRRVRLLIVLGIVVSGFACYRWRLIHAHTFGALGLVFVAALPLVIAPGGRASIAPDVHHR